MADDHSSALMDFREFLVSKADEFGVRDRHRRRREWLDSIHAFMDQVRIWLAEADPEQILDVEVYRVSRTEATLGTYDAPALQINFGPGSVEITPIDRYTSSSSSRFVSPLINEPAGRIDLTDGWRKTSVYRGVGPDGDRWRFVDEKNHVQELDQESFVRIIQELLS